MKKTLLVSAVLVLSTPLFAQKLLTYDVGGNVTGYVLLAPQAAQYRAEFAPTGAVTSLTVNGQPIAGDVHLVIGDDNTPSTFDPATNTLAISNTSIKQRGKGSVAEGNTTISGTLTVTNSCYFNTNIGMVTTIYGQLIVSHTLATGGTSVTISYDVTTVPDAGGTVTMTLPTAVAGRHLDIYNESATYNVTDGGSNTIAPASILHLTGVDVTGGGAAWK